MLRHADTDDVPPGGDRTGAVPQDQRLRAVLRHYQLRPEKRLAALMADWRGVKLVTATIAQISEDCAHRLGFADAVRDHVAAAPVRHLDDAGSGARKWPPTRTRKCPPQTLYRYSIKIVNLRVALTRKEFLSLDMFGRQE
jgi:hypothetical protein